MQLEQQLPRIGEKRRRFSPVLTTMLEDRKMVERFMLAYLYRFIRIEPSENRNSPWMFFLPTERRRRWDHFGLTKPSHLSTDQ